MIPSVICRIASLQVWTGDHLILGGSCPSASWPVEGNPAPKCGMLKSCESDVIMLARLHSSYLLGKILWFDVSGDVSGVGQGEKWNKT